MKESSENLDIKLGETVEDEIPVEDPEAPIEETLVEAEETPVEETEEETIEDGYSGDYDDYIQETNNKIHQEISVAGSIEAWEANYKNLKENVILHDVDCFNFSNDDKIRVEIQCNEKNSVLINRINKAKNESSPIIVIEKGKDLGEWEVEEWREYENEGRKFSFFQLKPFLHIWIKQEPDKMYHSFPRIDKHVVSYEIKDRHVRLDYAENRTACGSANKILPVDLYIRLKKFLRSYSKYLNNNISSFDQELFTMNKFPFGGVSVKPYSYKIGEKEAYNVSPLFLNLSDCELERFNNIINKIEELL